jgi:hypothetical protein
MWLRVVGKVALAQAPPLNHSWAAALQVTPRRMSTHLLPYGLRSFMIEFDFAEHQLRVHRDLGEFIPPYEAVRTAPSPTAAIRAFIDSTYERAATFGRWDRGALERPDSVV